MLNKVAEEETKRLATPIKTEVTEKPKTKTAVLEGNLALKLLMNSREFSQIIGFKDKKR